MFVEFFDIKRLNSGKTNAILIASKKEIRIKRKKNKKK
jgi:hypothetical protein